MRVALTIAGSDPSGGAGIQADLKTFLHFDVHGLSVITAMAIQNSKGVAEIIGLQSHLLDRQLEILFSDFKISAAKTGMLYSRENILIVEDALKRYRVDQYILDPITLSSTGFPLLDPGAITIMKERLFPLATLVTPNLKEAETFSDLRISDKGELYRAAETIYSLGPKAVLIKGYKAGDKIIDLLYSAKGAHIFESELIPDKNIHGAGCLLSAAVTASVALGRDLEAAVEAARSFVFDRIKGSVRLGIGAGLSYLT